MSSIVHAGHVMASLPRNPFKLRQRSWLLAATLTLLSGTAECVAPGMPTVPTALRDGSRDFDFEIGTWRTQLKRLKDPLSGSNTWLEYKGTTIVRKVMDGRANLAELVAEGEAGRFEGISLRLYEPETRQWTLNFGNLASGTLATPTVGAFVGGRGVFYNQERYQGRAILVRFLIEPVNSDTVRFEQAFSADGGQTWEVNWIATDIRVAR